jgi:NAD-dependent protein deacetylase/lipoamidase
VNEHIEQLADVLARARRIVAFTGAGISTESGIPDFRGPSGIWKTLDPKDFTIDNYVSNPEHRKRVWAMRSGGTGPPPEPNDGHRALVELEHLGLLDCVVTQNIDGLHQRAGNTVVLELHGNMREAMCLNCAKRSPFEDIVDRVRAGEEDPHCTDCGGLLKAATVSFGQALPADVVDEAFARAEACDLCLVVGSSLVVYPAAGIPLHAKRSGARLAIVNAEETPLDDMAEVVVHDQAGAALTAAIAACRAQLHA